MACVFLVLAQPSGAVLGDVQARVAEPAHERLHTGPGLDVLEQLDLGLVRREVYEYKAESGVVDLAAYKPKVKLLKHIKTRAGVKTFVGGFRDARLNIAEYGS